MINLRKSLLSTAIVAATLGLSACGGSSGGSKEPTTPVNTAPTDISLSASAIVEDTLGAVVGDLSATDDTTSGFTFTVSDNRFEISGSTLKLVDAKAMNFEQTPNVDVEVTVTDAGGLTFTKTLTIATTDVDAENGVNVYEFDSNLGDGSSVVYTGQTARHALSAEIKSYMGKLSVEYINTNNITAAEVDAKLKSLWGFEKGDYEAIADQPITHLGNDLSMYKQTTFAQISSSDKELGGKIAGEDGTNMYQEWLVPGTFKGWTDFGGKAQTPEGLIEYFFARLVAQVEMINNGTELRDNNDALITKAYITPEGHDLVQLVQKHTLGAVMFSQGTDDYLDQGLATDNKESYKGKNYTKLEHQFDEGFGYFGASRDYLEYSDKEIAKKVASEADGRADYNGKHDTNGDNMYDLAAEFIWGNSSNAAKRDLGASSIPTDMTAETMTNFIAARKMIHDNHGSDISELSADLQAKFNQHVFDAALAWEKAIAATVVHYINDVLDNDDGDIDDIIAGNYDSAQFEAYAKHWGEMKGFALNFQFSPYSPFADSELNPKKDTVGAAKFVELHELMKDKPVIATDGADAYKADLVKARDLLTSAYNFNADNAIGW